MDLEKLLVKNSRISFNLNGDDLMQFANEVALKTAQLILDANNEKLYSRDEVASLFKISLPTLWRWEKNGQIKGKKVGGRVLYTENEIKRLLNKNG